MLGMVSGLFGGLSLKLYLGMALLAAGGFAYYSYSSMQAELELAKNTIGQLEYTIEANNAVQEELNKFNAEAKIELQSLQTKIIEQTEYGNELKEKLQKHNLTKLAARKPGLIEKRINDASDKLISDIISDTSN